MTLMQDSRVQTRHGFPQHGNDVSAWLAPAHAHRGQGLAPALCLVLQRGSEMLAELMQKENHIYLVLLDIRPLS